MIHCVYAVSVADFRAASYYGALVRHRSVFHPLVFLLPIAVLYLAGVLAGLWGYYPLVGCLLLAHGVCMVAFFAGVERSMLRYTRSDRSMIGKEAVMDCTKEYVEVKIPSQGTHFKVRCAELACVIELRRSYLLYLSAEDLLILPKSALCGQEEAFRSLLRSAIGDRFGVKFMVPASGG